MKNLIIMILMFAMVTVGAVGCKDSDSVMVDFAVDTLAMAIGYEVRGNFDWNEDVDRYYNAILEGKISLDAAKAAESYLKKKTHPLIANRLVTIAGMVGFDLNEVGGLIGVDGVDMGLLKTAAIGFRVGLSLE